MTWATWVHELRGDLDWIVMKALEKDRARRYGSANELASDVSRHLRDEPVLARPPSTIYRMGKFVRRHRAGVAAGALVTAALLAGLAFATVGLIRARRAERLANTQVELLVAMIESLDPNAGPGRSARPEEVLAALARRIDVELSERPLVRSRLLLSMARIYQNLEAHERARPLFEEALRVQRQQGLPDSEPAVVAFTLRSLGDLEGVMGDYPASRRHLEEALAIAERHLGPEHDTAVVSLADLALLLWRNGEYAEAKRLAERAVALREKSAGADDLSLAFSLFVRGVALHGLGELEAAHQTLERALRIRERVLGPDATDVAWALDRLGLVFLAQGEWERAAQLLERAVRIQEARFGPESFNLIEPLSGLGSVRLSLGDASGAERLFQRALNLQQRPSEPTIISWRGPWTASGAWPRSRATPGVPENSSSAPWGCGRARSAPITPSWRRASGCSAGWRFVRARTSGRFRCSSGAPESWRPTRRRLPSGSPGPASTWRGSGSEWATGSRRDGSTTLSAAGSPAKGSRRPVTTWSSAASRSSSERLTRR